MSFKERIIKHCTVKRRGNCAKCVFKEPCNKANNSTMPRLFSDKELEVMEQEIVFHMSKISAQLSEMAKFMTEVSEDRLKDLKGGQSEK